MFGEPTGVNGGAKAESLARNAKDPLNLIQVMLAEGGTSVPAIAAKFFKSIFLNQWS